MYICKIDTGKIVGFSFEEKGVSLLLDNVKKDYPNQKYEIISANIDEWRELIKIQNETNLSYQEKRKREYPPIEDFLDSKVKQGSLDELIKLEGIKQEQDYINKCLAVKEKYPKV